MWKYMDYTDTLRDYIYQKWFLSGVEVAFQFAIALGVTFLAWKYCKRQWILWRTGTMTPKRYREWQLSVWASRLVDMNDRMVADGYFSRKEMAELQEMIGHRCCVWDLVPRERAERPPASVLKALIRGRLKNPPRKKETNGSAKLEDVLHDVINGTPKPGDK